ncbi:aspartate/glutamate racemase family protein [Undibacterium sp. TJN19]|uniref:aspartate/glutamate racemase family protein n=1 Tax=Undibacterium sp. TJN19 TaxID=3413055 RepID=UPI003BF3B05F
MTTSHKTSRKRLGIIGGLGALAGADVYFKLMRTVTQRGGMENDDILFEQHPFDGDDHSAKASPDLNGRKLYIFDMMKQFEGRQIDSVLVPCFISHTFLDELEAELALPVVNIMHALLQHLRSALPSSHKIGVLTSDYVKKNQLFERYFEKQDYVLVYPNLEIQDACVMQAIYGVNGIKTGNLQGDALDLLQKACENLMEQGVDVIIPGATEIAIVAEALRHRGIPILDANQAYVDYALTHDETVRPSSYKIGIIGGVGPAATVDFMEKIIKNTDARRDQDHIKLIVEHNPKIPDRTANLIAGGEDPTLAIYAACKRLEANDAAVIAIPCNTAHAYVARIQPYLSIPIVNMLFETISFIRHHHSEQSQVGLLATTGTISSRVYHDAARGAHFDLMVPDDAHQDQLMRAIYGEKGIKAGYLEGECLEDLMQALRHLVRRGATVVILGCTELPLLLSQTTDFFIDGKRVALLDPTEILARRCVSLSEENAQLTHQH